MGRKVKVADASDVPANGGTCVEVDGRRIALFNAGGTYYAIDDTCTHEEAPLHQGTIDGEEVECPWHMATFNLKTGECTGPPADEDVNAYPVTVENGEIHLEIEG